MGVRVGRRPETAARKPERACKWTKWSKAEKMSDEALLLAGRGGAYGISKLGAREAFP